MIYITTPKAVSSMKNSYNITSQMTTVNNHSVSSTTRDNTHPEKTANYKKDNTQYSTYPKKNVDKHKEIDPWEEYAKDRYCGWWL